MHSICAPRNVLHFTESSLGPKALWLLAAAAIAAGKFTYAGSNSRSADLLPSSLNLSRRRTQSPLDLTLDAKDPRRSLRGTGT